MKKKFADSMRVKEPCTESWDEMSGNDNVRFCSHCAKNVNDLSTMTRKEALKLVRRSGGSLCIRYIEHPETKAPVYADTFTQITRRRVPLMAAGVMTASLSLSTLTYAQGAAALTRPERTKSVACEDVVKTENSTGNGSLKGTVVDPIGAAVPNIGVTLLDDKGAVGRRIASDAAGEFRFDRLSFGTYMIRTDAATGFASRVVENIVVGEVESSLVVELAFTPPQQNVILGVVMSLPLTPVSSLLEDNELESVRDLLARGEDVNRKEDDGRTPIFSAVEDNNVEAVKLLLDFGAKVNVRDDERRTPLMVIDEDTTLEMVELLLLHGAKVNRVDNRGNTALITAAGTAKPEILEALIRAGADLDAQNEEGVTALMKAADAENLANVRLLVEAGANVNLRDKEDDNAWDFTAEEEIEAYLVAHGVVLDAEDKPNQ